MMITALIVAFSQGWELTLITLCMLPFIFISSLLFGHYNTAKK
jgi:ABC-type multidrug transport system fused ATPase/permease subunit